VGRGGELQAHAKWVASVAEPRDRPETMDSKAILLPVCAQVWLTFLVWIWMFISRIGAIRRSRVNIQALAEPSRADAVFKDAVNPSDNFENLFELPVLFYVAMVILFVLGFTDQMYVWAAWVFVAFRALHSLIHCTSNRIRHRFNAYFAGSLVLWAIWIRITIQLVTR
jgi:hypothetical protein